MPDAFFPWGPLMDGPVLPGKPLSYDPLLPKLVSLPPQGAVTLRCKQLSSSLEGTETC